MAISLVRRNSCIHWAQAKCLYLLQNNSRTKRFAGWVSYDVFTKYINIWTLWSYTKAIVKSYSSSQFSRFCRMWTMVPTWNSMEAAISLLPTWRDISSQIVLQNWDRNYYTFSHAINTWSILYQVLVRAVCKFSKTYTNKTSRPRHSYNITTGALF